MCSAIAPCSGCSACTVTCVSGAASFLQPGQHDQGQSPRPPAKSSSSSQAAPSSSMSSSSIFILGSHRSRQRLQIGPRRLVAHSSILARIFARSHRRFARPPLPAPWPRRRRSAAWSAAGSPPPWPRSHPAKQADRAPPRLRSKPRPAGDQPALRRRQRHPRCVAADLALLYLVLGCKPVPTGISRVTLAE